MKKKIKLFLLMLVLKDIDAYYRKGRIAGTYMMPRHLKLFRKIASL